MEATKTLTPDAGAGGDAAPRTLAAGELVWAKPRGRGRRWWPARMLAACAVDAGAASLAAVVSYLGDPGAAPPGPPAQVRRFADPDADGMARGSTARAFLAAVEDAHARAVADLRADLACACVPPPSPDAGGVCDGVANLAPAEFLSALLDAALDVSRAGFVDRARLKSWTRAFGEGWGPDGARHYPRRPVKDLEDKIDLDVLAGEDRDAEDCLTDDEGKPLDSADEAPTQKKRNKRSAITGKLDAEDSEDKNGSTIAPGTSGKRERKRSKYLSPPYTNLGVFVLPRKVVDLPKALVSDTAEVDIKVLPDSIAVDEALLLVRALAEDAQHRSSFLKDAEGFLSSFRTFRRPPLTEDAEYESYMVLVTKQVGADIAAGSVSDSHAVLKQGKCLSRRSRKKDEDGSAVGSSKRKKSEKTPTATLARGISITPAIPIRQVRAEDIRSQIKGACDARCMGAGVQDEKTKPSALTCPVSAAAPGTTKQGQEQLQANDESAVRTPVAASNTLSDQTLKESDEAKLGAAKSETNVQTVIVDLPVRSVQTEAMDLEVKIRVDENVSTVADIPVKSVSKEAIKSEANACIDENVQSVIADVPDISVSKVATDADIHIGKNVHSVVPDISVRSGPSPMPGAQPVDEKKEHASVELHTVQQSYASLEAMVPEMLPKVGSTNGTDVIAVNNALKYECQKDELSNQKVKLTAGAAANNFSGEAVNGTCPDAANSTQKKKKKKAAQVFENPAAIVLEFTPGVIVPSREELLSAFGKFGFLIESHTEIRKDTRSARVVFGKSTEAEAAYRSAETLGQFGPPFVTNLRLEFLPPIKLSRSPPPPPLPPASTPEDVRRNIEKMISYLTQKKANSPNGLDPASERDLMEMHKLLAKVKTMVCGPSTSTAP
ncbi:hypothetical protein ACP70R_030290 [Stipagrostis hirtigluma subsp. patula]